MCLGSMISKYFYTGSVLMERKIIESVIWKREYFLIATVNFYAKNSDKADGKIQNETEQVT